VVTVLPEILDRYDNRTAPGVSTSLDSEEQSATTQQQEAQNTITALETQVAGQSTSGVPTSLDSEEQSATTQQQEAQNTITALETQVAGQSTIAQSIQETRYVGSGQTASGLQFTLTIDLTVSPDNNVSGYHNDTGLPDSTLICGAGEITGTRNGNNIEYTFTSNDPDPGCGFDRGWVFTFRGTLSPDERILQGNWIIDNGQEGIFWAEAVD
jgi:hypothetical protein